MLITLKHNLQHTNINNKYINKNNLTMGFKLSTFEIQILLAMKSGAGPDSSARH